MTPEICLALALFFEARSEPPKGQLAVAHVVLNRVIQNNSDVCQEVFKPFQFSWTKDYKQGRVRVKNKEDFAKMEALAEQVLNGETNDPTRGSTSFHNDEVVPTWSYKMKKMLHIGNHTFYK